MRRWVCIIALLTGFSSQAYVWTARPRPPTPVERPFDRPPDPAGRRSSWWVRI